MKIMVAHEAPISILDKVQLITDYDYCLVHLLEKHKSYYDFFKKAIINNREVLLDNSIFELGVSFDPSKFANYVNELNPTYYIVPDVLEDGYKTIDSFASFIDKYNELKGLKIGVVQGRSYDELVECYKFISAAADYIAISFDYSYYVGTGLGKTKLERWCNGRQKFVKNLIDDGYWNWNKPHHLLGCSLAKEFNYYINNNIYNIRSVDTSNPVVAGIKGLKYAGNLGLTEKPSIKLADLIEHNVTEDEFENIQYNINQFKNIITK